MSLSLKKMGRHLPNGVPVPEDNKEKSMVTEYKRVEYWSKSNQKWMPLDQMHHEHLLNLIIKLVSKDYDGSFRVITKTTETKELEDEYVVTSYIQ